MSMVGAIFILAIPIAVIIFTVSAVARSVRKDNVNEESFQDVIRTIYIYLIMIIFLSLFVVATISLFNSCLQILLPETSQDIYNSSIVSRNTAIAEVTTNISIICISIPMFLYYSKLVKKDNGNSKNNIKSEEK